MSSILQRMVQMYIFVSSFLNINPNDYWSGNSGKVNQAVVTNIENISKI